MSHWTLDSNGVQVFAGGHDDWAGAALQAAGCSGFVGDVEEEQVADDPRSCYNCRYRRWTATSFRCNKDMHLVHTLEENNVTYGERGENGSHSAARGNKEQVHVM